MQQNLIIFIVSYVFYGWWDWRFLCLIALTSFFSYASGLLLERNEGHQRWRQVVSAANIVLNLSILGTFKYYNFFVENLDALFGMMGYHLDWATMNVILPVGISFYTFQALSYSIDVYQKKLPATHDIVDFFAYISFFPQLVAGPIERATNLLPQFNQMRQFDYAQSVNGFRQMLWGFFKKVVVADICAHYVNQYWDYYEELPGLMLVELAVLFTFQIYCDFSGYSDIAIGCAKLFGIRLAKNFDLPYFSRNIGEFWRRWHISLMSWFRDYVYIPLGGNRCAKWHAMANVLIVFLISGVWHGANWTFVAWGGYNGVLIVLANVIGWNTKYHEVVAAGKMLPSLKETFLIILTFCFVVIGWIIFRAEDMTQMKGYFHAMIINNFIGSRLVIFYVPLVVILVLLIIEWGARNKQHVLACPSKGMFRYRYVRWGVYYIMVLTIYRFWGFAQDFIYFQF